MNFEELEIPGCYRIDYRKFEDARGRFVKTFHEPSFTERGLETDFRETFYSFSERGVFRGFHYQAPPHDHAKLVHVLQGRVLDAFLDLRPSSPTYGRAGTAILDEEEATGLYLPTGVAHGFLSHAPKSVMLYQVTTAHAPDSDTGVRFETVDVDWGFAGDIEMSDRDRGLPTWDEYAASPHFD